MPKKDSTQQPKSQTSHKNVIEFPLSGRTRVARKQTPKTFRQVLSDFRVRDFGPSVAASSVSANPRCQSLLKETSDLDREFLGGKSAAEKLQSVYRYLCFIDGPDKHERSLSKRNALEFRAADKAKALVTDALRNAGDDYDENRIAFWADVTSTARVANLADQKRDEMIAGKITERQYREWMAAHWPEALQSSPLDRVRARRRAANQNRRLAALAVSGD